jgi:hypothetical protein
MKSTTTMKSCKCSDSQLKLKHCIMSYSILKKAQKQPTYHGLSCLHKLNTSIVQTIELKRGFKIQNKNNNKYCIDILALYSNHSQ